MSNLIRNVSETVSQYGKRTAVSFRGVETTYDEFWDQTGRFAAGLRKRGFETGDRVAIYLPNLPQFVVAFHGTLCAGGAVVPINPQYKHRELYHLLSDSEATVVVTLADLASNVVNIADETNVKHVVTVDEAIDSAYTLKAFLGDSPADIVERSSDDIAVLPYTSGTTGKPKGVMLTHKNLASNTATAAGLIPDGVTTTDKQLGVLPLFHIFGMTVVMNTTLFNGGTFYPMSEWDVDNAISLIEDEDLTIMHLVPAMYNDIITHPEADSFDLSSLRLCGVGGSGIPAEVAHRFEEMYGHTIYEGYGLTETSPATHFSTPSQGRRIGSIGKPVDSVDAKIVNDDFEELPHVEEGPIDEDSVDLNEIVGEIVVSGPNVMKGYLDRPEANKEAFTYENGKRWFHTEDLGYWDEEEFFYVVDREKHMIVTGGYNVYPWEIEELLFEHDAVADAAVVGIQDERRGETVKAIVVPTEGYEAGNDVTEDDIREYCLDNLAAYKHPRVVEFVEDLPRTTTGKIQKFELHNDPNRV